MRQISRTEGDLEVHSGKLFKGPEQYRPKSMSLWRGGSFRLVRKEKIIHYFSTYINNIANFLIIHTIMSVSDQNTSYERDPMFFAFSTNRSHLFSTDPTPGPILELC